MIPHSHTIGEGPPLLLLHGFMGMGDNLKTIADGLAKHHKVFLLDARNHGESPHSEAMNYPDMATDLHDFCKAKGLRSVSVLGHSMGGKTAMTFAAKWPNKVNKLIVADIAPRPYKDRYSQDLRSLLDLDLGTINTRHDADLALQQNLPNPNIRAFFLKNLSYANNGKLYWKCNLPVLLKTLPNTIDFPPIPDGNTTKSLFITGGKSDYVSAADKDLIRKKFLNATFAEINGAGHWLHAQKPTEFVGAVQQFLTRPF